MTMSLASSSNSASVHPLCFLTAGADGGCASFLTIASSLEPGSGARPRESFFGGDAGAVGVAGVSSGVEQSLSLRGAPANRRPSSADLASPAASSDRKVMYHPSASANVCRGKEVSSSTWGRYRRWEKSAPDRSRICQSTAAGRHYSEQPEDQCESVDPPGRDASR
jgi:hypothetical protein